MAKSNEELEAEIVELRDEIAQLRKQVIALSGKTAERFTRIRKENAAPPTKLR